MNGWVSPATPHSAWGAPARPWSPYSPASLFVTRVIGSDGDLATVPVVGQASTTEGWSVGEALTSSSGSILVDATIGGALGYLIAPASKRALYVLVGAGGAGIVGVLGLVGLITLAFIDRGRG